MKCDWRDVGSSVMSILCIFRLFHLSWRQLRSCRDHGKIKLDRNEDSVPWWSSTLDENGVIHSARWHKRSMEPTMIQTRIAARSMNHRFRHIVNTGIVRSRTVAAKNPATSIFGRYVLNTFVTLFGSVEQPKITKIFTVRVSNMYYFTMYKSCQDT